MPQFWRTHLFQSRPSAAPTRAFHRLTQPKMPAWEYRAALCDIGPSNAIARTVSFLEAWAFRDGGPKTAFARNPFLRAYISRR